MRSCACCPMAPCTCAAAHRTSAPVRTRSSPRSPAVRDAALKARDELIARAIADPASPFHGRAASDVSIEAGALSDAKNAQQRELIAVLLARNGGQPIETEGAAKPA